MCIKLWLERRANNVLVTSLTLARANFMIWNYNTTNFKDNDLKF